MTYKLIKRQNLICVHSTQPREKIKLISPESDIITQMKFTKLAIPDLVLIEPRVIEDSRGFFYESYRAIDFEKNGICENFVQDNFSRSQKGVLRGLHYQIEPKAQAKLIRVTRGEVFDVAVDIRPNSKTFGKHVSLVLSEENKKALFVPKGFAHGFLVLKDGTEFQYKVSDYYSPEHEFGIKWDDPSLGIPWPNLGMRYTLSEKDRKNPPLSKIPA